MKFIAQLLSVLFIVLSLAACCKKPLDRDNCMHCSGCFNSWDECKEDYHQDSLHPLTWEQYVDSAIAMNGMSTDYCERAQ